MEADMSKHLQDDLLKAGLPESEAPSSHHHPPLAYPIEDVPAKTGIPRTKVFEAIRKKKSLPRMIAQKNLRLERGIP
jgi:hypothetical protein